MNQLQKNIAKTQRKSHPTPQIPPMKVRKNVTKLHTHEQTMLG